MELTASSTAMCMIAMTRAVRGGRIARRNRGEGPGRGGSRWCGPAPSPAWRPRSRAGAYRARESSGRQLLVRPALYKKPRIRVSMSAGRATRFSWASSGIRRSSGVAWGAALNCLPRSTRRSFGIPTWARAGAAEPRANVTIVTALHSYFITTTKNAARMPQINERNRLPWSALRCHRDRLSTTILAPFLAVVS